MYLNLRQEKYGLRCVVFRSVAQGLPFWIEYGQTLLIQGEIEVDAVWGELRIVARKVQLMTTATDEDEPETLKTRAQAEGWLDPARKRPLPPMP